MLPNHSGTLSSFFDIWMKTSCTYLSWCLMTNSHLHWLTKNGIELFFHSWHLLWKTMKYYAYYVKMNENIWCQSRVCICLLQTLANLGQIDVNPLLRRGQFVLRQMTILIFAEYNSLELAWFLFVFSTKLELTNSCKNISNEQFSFILV